jgi:hypothetical protein
VRDELATKKTPTTSFRLVYCKIVPNHGVCNYGYENEIVQNGRFQIRRNIKPMRPRRFYYGLIIFHGLYLLITAIWPLIDIESFMRVTGPKTDIWLVKTVAVLLIPVSICILFPLFSRINPILSILVSLLCTAGLAAIDFYYTSTETISNVYRYDGFLQVILFVSWLSILIRNRQVLLQVPNTG